MQVESFKVFRDLVESQSFSKAASMNFITQSAVSQQVRAIEDRFHVALLERTSKKFALTSEGQIFYESAKSIVSEYEAMAHKLEETRNVVAGTIRVATVYSIGLHELPPYLKKFLKEFPTVNVQVEYQRFSQVYQEILDGTSDFGLVAFPAGKKGITMEPFRKDRLVLICHPHHAFAQRQSIELQDLAKVKLIGFEPDIPTRKAIDKILKDAGISIEPSREFDNIETVKRAVEIDEGVSIVPMATVQQEVQNKALVAVEFAGEPFYRPLGIIYRSGRVLSPAMKRFLEVLHTPMGDGSEPIKAA